MRQYCYLSAKVINISTNRNTNYLTIDKGTDDGINKGMGVISSTGIVGIVKNVSGNFASVIPIINPHFTLVAMHQKSGERGRIKWEANNNYSRAWNPTEAEGFESIFIGQF